MSSFEFKRNSSHVRKSSRGHGVSFSQHDVETLSQGIALYQKDSQFKPIVTPQPPPNPLKFNAIPKRGGLSSPTQNNAPNLSVEQDILPINHAESICKPMDLQVTDECKGVECFNHKVQRRDLNLKTLRHVLTPKNQHGILQLIFHGHYDHEKDQFTLNLDTITAIYQLLEGPYCYYFAALCFFVEKEVLYLIHSTDGVVPWRLINVNHEMFAYPLIRNLINSVVRRFGCRCCFVPQTDGSLQIQISRGDGELYQHNGQYVYSKQVRMFINQLGPGGITATTISCVDVHHVAQCDLSWDSSNVLYRQFIYGAVTDGEITMLLIACLSDYIGKVVLSR